MPYSYEIQTVTDDAPGSRFVVLRLSRTVGASDEPRFYDAEGNFWPSIEEAAYNPFHRIAAASEFINTARKLDRVASEATEPDDPDLDMDDSERLTWLEDQLWNGWELGAYSDAGAHPHFHLTRSEDDDRICAPTLREAIDKAAAEES